MPALESVLSGPGPVFWAILISATVAAILALLTITKTRIIAKKRAAFDFISGLWVQNRENAILFHKLIEKGELLKALEEDSEHKSKITMYLNTFELLAVSIEQNVLDENICKAIIGDGLVKEWQKAYPLINAIRTKEGDQEFYENFEALATKWKKFPTIKKVFWLLALIKEIPKV